MEKCFIRWETVELRLQTGDGNHSHPLSRVRLSEDKVLVSGVKIDGDNPQDSFHLGYKELLNRASPFKIWEAECWRRSGS